MHRESSVQDVARYLYDVVLSYREYSQRLSVNIYCEGIYSLER